MIYEHRITPFLLHVFHSPAGTGKTETVKDLGRALGIMVYVFNCSEQMDYKSLGNIFKGLAQSGSWGCFDEFNRISLEVLSVVATQVRSVLNAIRARKVKFNFQGNRTMFSLMSYDKNVQVHPLFWRLFKLILNFRTSPGSGEEISLSWSCGSFITMNPGYTGRVELPENIKSLFRPCSMVVPDTELICEIMLLSQGFMNTTILARKFATLYALCTDLLASQDHYDWGLRTMKPVLVVAGTLKRKDLTAPEEHILMRALRESNIPKLVADDVAVFLNLLSDIFPNVEAERRVNRKLEDAVRKAALELGLQAEDAFVLKVSQLEELLTLRHSVFILGESVCIQAAHFRSIATFIISFYFMMQLFDALAPYLIYRNSPFMEHCRHALLMFCINQEGQRLERQQVGEF
jgi:dynein heavy chain, axonemal